MANSLAGKMIQFHAERIFKGNPVIGIVTQEDEEWIVVTLNHDIEGMVNSWEAGETKQFRKILISNIKTLTTK